MRAALSSPHSIDQAHSEVVSRGWKLLQPFRFAETDSEHVQILLNVANFPQSVRILDVGCGIGECARLMKVARPDLEFVLLNFSEKQLADCPEGFETILASAHDLPFADESFDAVMFNAALGNMDCMVALAESSRVLKPGGILFLNELSCVSGDNSAMERILSFRAYDTPEIVSFAEAMGLSRTPVEPPPVSREYLREQIDAAAYLEAFDGVAPLLARFVKGAVTPLAAKHGALFARHESIALQVSGGKDSLAVLDAMRPWWDRLCVFWLNPGDPFPETVTLMARIRAEVPYFVEISGRQKEIIDQDGWPSDVVPQSHTTDGNYVFGPTSFKVQARLSCCYRALMLPMHECMVAAGVTCIIRGKRSEEKDKTPSRSGETHNGFELVYPLWDWTEDDVLGYLRENGIELPESYAHASHSLDCMSCTSWWGEGLSHFLKAKHPKRYVEYVRRVTLIKSAIADEMNNCEV